MKATCDLRLVTGTLAACDALGVPRASFYRHQRDENEQAATTLRTAPRRSKPR